MKEHESNPFIYSTPDQIQDATRALDLFVDVFKDFYLLESPGNTFINGARGSGKSMMFRIMMPDCQKIKSNKPLKELKYFSVYVPIKNTSLDITELEYLKGRHGEHLFNEHILTIYMTISIFRSLSDEKISPEHQTELKNFFNDIFIKRLSAAGQNVKEIQTGDFLLKAIEILEKIQEDFTHYLQRLVLSPKNLAYNGPLCLYRNFLLPIIESINSFSFMPASPLLLLVDDADLLNENQTKILNSWVSFRSTSKVCFKISTQLNYKTWVTTNSSNKIASPHDYHEINFSDIYTSNPKEKYKDNVKEIVEKRLRVLSNVEVSAEEFFPEDITQKQKIAENFSRLEASNNYDFAYRTARPDYMISLPNEYTYSYGGFDQLVHLSSGIIRNFIDLASKMYEKTSKDKQDDSILAIPIAIQDREIKEYSNWVIQQLDKAIDDKGLEKYTVDKYKFLKNLVNGIGKAFRLYLESAHTERRKFSFYFEGDAQDDLKEVLKLGVSEGFFHYSTHGSKTGLGRAHKYVLNRMVSPVFKLDPFSFSGYLHLPVERLELAMRNEKRFLDYIKERISKGDKDPEAKDQLEIQFEKS